MAGREDSGPGEHAVLTHLVVQANELTPRIRRCLLFVRSWPAFWATTSRDAAASGISEDSGWGWLAGDNAPPSESASANERTNSVPVSSPHAFIEGQTSFIEAG